MRKCYWEDYPLNSLQKETRRGSSAHQLAARAILREEYGNEKK